MADHGHNHKSHNSHGRPHKGRDSGFIAEILRRAKALTKVAVNTGTTRINVQNPRLGLGEGFVRSELIPDPGTGVQTRPIPGGEAVDFPGTEFRVGTFDRLEAERLAFDEGKDVDIQPPRSRAQISESEHERIIEELQEARKAAGKVKGTTDRFKISKEQREVENMKAVLTKTKNPRLREALRKRVKKAQAAAERIDDKRFRRVVRARRADDKIHKRISFEEQRRDLLRRAADASRKAQELDE